jgi:hypothetical protein
MFMSSFLSFNRIDCSRDIARSTCDEAIQTVSADAFWIASLRSQ